MIKDRVSSYIILGLLSIKPMSGYDIKYWITNGVGNFWCMSYGQIYPALKEFVEEEMVTFLTERQEGRPEKKIYTITDKGRGILERWLLEPIDFHSNNYSSTLTAKVFFGSNIGAEEVIKHLRDAVDHENKKLERLFKIEEEMNADKAKAIEYNDKSFFYRMCTLKEGMIMVKAQLEWCKQTIEDLIKKESY